MKLSERVLSEGTSISCRKHLKRLEKELQAPELSDLNDATISESEKSAQQSNVQRDETNERRFKSIPP